MRIFLFAMLPILLASSDVQAEQLKEWRAAAAPYRLIAVPEKPGEAGSIDLRRLVLPVLPATGVAVFDDRGLDVPFQFHDNFSLSFAPSPEAKHFEIYFGFDEKEEFDRWGEKSGPRPSPHRLQLDFFSRGPRYCTPEEYFIFRLDEIDRQNRWHYQNFYRRAFTILCQKDLGAEPKPWIPDIRQYNRNRRNLLKRLVAKNRGQRNNAFITLSGGRPRMIRQREFYRVWQHHFRNHMLNINREQERIANLQTQAFLDMDYIPRRNLLDIVKWNHPRIFPATEVQLMTRPPETAEHYSAHFHGFLQVPADGEYEFELYSNSLTILQLSGQTVASRLDANGTQEATRQVVRLPLTRGSVPFALYFRVGKGFGQLTLGMRPAGKGKFQLLAAEHFTPARAATPVRLESKSGTSYPLLSRHGHYLLYPGKLERVPIEGFDFYTPVEELEYQFGDAPFAPASSLPPAVVLARTPELRFRFREEPESLLTVRVPEYREDLVPLQCDLSLKLWNPAVIYEDEPLTVTAEVISKLPLPVDAQLEIALDGTAYQGERTLRISSKTDERFNRAAEDIYRKIPLNFPSLLRRPSRSLELRLNIGSFEFDRKQLTIRPVSEAGPEDLPNDTAITWVLRRPKLSDVRNWELPRRIGDELTTGRKLLLIAESGYGLDALPEESSLKEFEFLPVDNFPAGLGKLLWGITRSEADRALLLLPCLPHLGSQENWQRDRYFAALLEKLRGNRGIHQIYLAPAPCTTEEKEELERKLLPSLRRLAREYDVILLEELPSVSYAEGPVRPFHPTVGIEKFTEKLRKKL